MINKYCMNAMPLVVLKELDEREIEMLNRKYEEYRNASYFKIFFSIIAIVTIIAAMVTDERLWLAATASTLLATFILNWTQNDDEKELVNMIADIIIKKDLIRESLKEYKCNEKI